MNKNDITGDSLISKPSTKEYEEGWDRVFCKHTWRWDGQSMMHDYWYCTKCKATKTSGMDI